MKQNKKGAGPAIFGIGFVVAIFLAIVFVIFLTGGGVGAIWDISKFLKDIPTFVWVIFGVIVVFKILGGGKRRR